jgi:hypothetical protein
VLLPYNPWDQGTRDEGVPDWVSLAKLSSALQVPNSPFPLRRVPLFLHSSAEFLFSTISFKVRLLCSLPSRRSSLAFCVCIYHLEMECSVGPVFFFSTSHRRSITWKDADRRIQRRHYGQCRRGVLGCWYGYLYFRLFGFLCCRCVGVFERLLNCRVVGAPPAFD